MHYYIDGYNLLFRLHDKGENLQSQREHIIKDLNKKIALVKLDVSIVFDSPFQMGDQSRSHYHALEIVYTSEGETADELILDELKNSYNPELETIVTSDKKLARRAKNHMAQIKSVEEFIEWLNRVYKNKLKKRKQEKKTEPIQSPRPSISLTPPSNAPLEKYTKYYTQIFESKWQEMLKEEEKSKKEKTTPKRKGKKKSNIDPFQTPPTLENQETNEMERWLKLFEKRLSQSDEKSK